MGGTRSWPVLIRNWSSPGRCPTAVAEEGEQRGVVAQRKFSKVGAPENRLAPSGAMPEYSQAVDAGIEDDVQTERPHPLGEGLPSDRVPVSPALETPNQNTSHPSWRRPSTYQVDPEVTAPEIAPSALYEERTTVARDLAPSAANVGGDPEADGVVPRPGRAALRDPQRSSSISLGG
jgi:hypothetical protein